MALSSQSETKGYVPGDLIIYELDQLFTRESASVQNDSTTGGTYGAITIDDTELLGQPVKLTSGVWEFASAANVTAGTVNGIIVSGDEITALAADASTSGKYAILARGPAVINEGKIPALDVYEDAITAADYITAVEALDIQTKPAPSTTETQTS